MINVLWGERPELVKETMSVNGATRACIESNRRTPLPTWMTEEVSRILIVFPRCVGAKEYFPGRRNDSDLPPHWGPHSTTLLVPLRQ